MLTKSQEIKIREDFLKHPELAGAHGYCNAIMANKIVDFFLSRFREMEGEECEGCKISIFHTHCPVCGKGECDCKPKEEKECPRCGGRKWSVPEWICDKCHWQAKPKEERSCCLKCGYFNNGGVLTINIEGCSDADCPNCHVSQSKDEVSLCCGSPMVKHHSVGICFKCFKPFIPSQEKECGKLISVYGGGTRPCPNKLPCPMEYHSGEPRVSANSLEQSEPTCCPLCGLSKMNKVDHVCDKEGVEKRESFSLGHLNTPSNDNKEPWWSEEFKQKCHTSFAKGGFLTTDLVGDWELDMVPIKSFIHLVEERARENTREDLIYRIKVYDIFKCGACDNKTSNLAHTQFCEFRTRLLKELSYE